MTPSAQNERTGPSHFGPVSLCQLDGEGARHKAGGEQAGTRFAREGQGPGRSSTTVAGEPNQACERRARELRPRSSEHLVVGPSSVVASQNNGSSVNLFNKGKHEKLYSN